MKTENRYLSRPRLFGCWILLTCAHLLARRAVAAESLAGAGWVGAGASGCPTCVGDPDLEFSAGLFYRFSLGPGNLGGNAGMLYFSEYPNDFDFASIRWLRCTAVEADGGGVQILRDLIGNLSQIVAPTTIVDFFRLGVEVHYGSPSIDKGFEARFYRRAAMGPFNSATGRYEIINPTGNLITTWVVASANDQAGKYEYRIEERKYATVQQKALRAAWLKGS